MNQLTTLKQSSLASNSIPIGIDVTMLLAASSFIQQVDGQEDPRAREAFAAVSTAFCNGSSLLLPLPQNSVDRNPFFLDLWMDRRAFRSIPGVELSDEAFCSLIDEGRADDFERYAEAFSRKFGQWIAFQFTSEISHAHMRRADPWVKLRCEPIVTAMIKKKKFRKLRAQINTLVRTQELDCPPSYRHLLGAEFADFPSLCIAYAMSVVFRGFSYAIAIGSQKTAASPLYCHHWVRDPIVFSFEDNGIDCKKSKKRLAEFPWGDILNGLLDKKAPIESRDPSRMREVLIGIREQSAQVASCMEQQFFLSDGETSDLDRLGDAELQVVDWLANAGVILKRKTAAISLLKPFFMNFGGMAIDKGAEQAYSSTPTSSLLFGIGAASIGMGTIVEQVKTIRPTTFMSSLDQKMHVLFLRKKFWRHFEDPNIREVVRALKTKA